VGDPPAIQGTAPGVTRRVRGLAARGMTASTGDDLSRARLRAPRYWPTWILLGALKLVAKLPFPVQLALGRGLGNALRVLLRKRRKVVEINLAACFPELSAADRADLLRRHFEALGMSFVEMGIGWFSPVSRLRKLVRVEGIEHFARARAEGRSALVLSAHLTPLETCFAILIDLWPGISCMYRPQRNA